MRCGESEEPGGGGKKEGGGGRSREGREKERERRKRGGGGRGERKVEERRRGVKGTLHSGRRETVHGVLAHTSVRAAVHGLACADGSSLVRGICVSLVPARFATTPPPPHVLSTAHPHPFLEVGYGSSPPPTLASRALWLPTWRRTVIAKSSSTLS